ncbi:hypothetical protein FHR92_002519 [Fontibacillus solani]|uniref:Uncharacterized protein n=1 Tax=Fontibacillus solani TaxID=1572857 RepID=A0A7W3XS08_9BACL|nr:hypothetical protein [Fontibacillus solani]
MAKTKTTAEPILENEHVKELLAILRDNNSPSTKDFLAVLNQVGAMEKQLDAAVKELSAMRQELKTAQAQNHPVKTALQKAVIVMQGQVLDLRERLTELKQTVIDGCKNAVAVFKENGISALDNVARFDIGELREIVSYDEMELDHMGDKKTATFFIISDTNTTYNFIVALAFSQMFNLLCERADSKYGGRLPHHVRVFMGRSRQHGTGSTARKAGCRYPLPNQYSQCLIFWHFGNISSDDKKRLSILIPPSD